MKAKLKLTLAVLAGAALGAAGIQGLNAQGKPVVYLIEEIDISNPDAFAKEFLPLIQAANKAAGVRSIAAGGKTTLGFRLCSPLHAANHDRERLAGPVGPSNLRRKLADEQE